MMKPKCLNPECGRRKTVEKLGDGTYRCRHCGAHFDDDPEEGGDHDSRNPAARLERAEGRRNH